MASINLDEIPTKPTLKIGDNLNIEVVKGKFNLSYKSEIAKLNGKFMSNSQVEKYQSTIAGWVLALERWVFGDGKNYLGFATKEMVDNNYLYLSESNYYYKRLLTDEVMEALCNEYATKDMISAMVDNCREYGQNRATALANALAMAASVMKTQNIMNDTNIQTNFNTCDSILSAAQIMSDAMMNAAAAGGEGGEGGFGAGGGGGGAGGGGSGGGGSSGGTGTSATKWYIHIDRAVGPGDNYELKADHKGQKTLTLATGTKSYCKERKDYYLTKYSDTYTENRKEAGL